MPVFREVSFVILTSQSHGTRPKNDVSQLAAETFSGAITVVVKKIEPMIVNKTRNFFMVL